jgi:hypothetical protein
LTFDKDKLLALAGLAPKVQKETKQPILLDFGWRRLLGIFCGVQQLRCINMRSQGKEKLFLTWHLRGHGHPSIAWL